MARLPRLYAPDLPQLVQAKLAQPLAAPGAPAPADALNAMAEWLGVGSARYRVAVHGWALLPDRIVVLATPSDDLGLPKLVQAMGRNLAACLRAGRVFAGRYRSALVEPSLWLLPALVWLETLPQTLGLSPSPDAWPWSSAAVHIGAASASMVWTQDHADYWACGNTPFDRQANYQRRLQDGLSAAQTRRIEQALSGQWALGEPDFVASLAHTASRRVTPGRRGRPRKAP